MQNNQNTGKIPETKTPEWIRRFYWWGDSSLLDLQTDRKTIVVQIINFGRWEHWVWLGSTYGTKTLRTIIQYIPASEFRPRALRLISLILGIRRMKYASRSDYLKAKRNSPSS